MRIPKNAKRVFRGTIYDTYQWKQRLFDGSNATFEGLRRPNTALILPTTAQGRVLIAKEKQPRTPMSYGTFGGRQEKGETPLGTAKRELLEETGMVSNDWKLIRLYKPESKIEYKIYVFAARNCRKVKEQDLDPGEKIKVKSLTFTQFISLLSTGKCSDIYLAFDVVKMQSNKKKLDRFKHELFGRDS